jgi:hypothetical protein
VIHSHSVRSICRVQRTLQRYGEIRRRSADSVATVHKDLARHLFTYSDGKREMKHDYDALREMVGLGRPGKQVIKDRKGRVLKQPLLKWENLTYAKYMSTGTVQPLRIHTAPPSLRCPVLGYSVDQPAVARVKRGSR